MSIKARLLLGISVLVVAAFAAIGVVTVRVTEAQMVARIDDSLVAGAKPPRFGPDDGGGERGYAKHATATLVLGPDGTLLHADPSGLADNPDPLPALSGLGTSGLSKKVNHIFTAGAADGSDRHFRVALMPFEGGGYYAVAAPLSDVDATVRSLTTVIALTGLGVLLAVIAIAWLTIRHALRPIDAMIGTAGLIAGGDFSHRVEHADAATEVGQLGQALNAMLARIEASFAAKEASEQRLRRFVADASHELRTPLTSIRGYAELYRSGAAASPEATARVLARIESEGARMGQLVEDLLLLARLDQGRPLGSGPVELVGVLEEAVAAARAVEPLRPITFERPAAAWVQGDADRLRQVADNLLSNARAHTAPETPVTLAIEQHDSGVQLRISDAGPGIALANAEHVFDRFYRVDESRSRARGGAGLGLSLVASLIAAHGGQVELQTAPGAGATFTITLPSAEPGATQATPEALEAATVS